MTGVDPEELTTGLIRVDLEGSIAWCNRSAAAMLAPAGATLEGRSIGELSAPLGQWVRQVAERRRALHAPEAVIDDGHTVADAFIQPLERAVLVELHPVAERVRQREMAERADRQQALSLMTRRLAHELRNPLAGVRGAAQLIAARGGDEAVARHADLIQREVDRITRLIERYAGEGRHASESVNLHRILAEADELVAAESGGRIAFSRDFDPSIPEFAGDGGGLHQLFLNLLRNAAQAGAGAIRLTTRIEHRSPLLDESERLAVRIDVEDDAGGVPERMRDKLFLPLVSGRAEGSGFGLAIVQQIARSHGGLVEFRPITGGSRFRVRLPLEPVPEADDG
jgi:two-component system nitrogen regulation sensor histidine kinase GlnL